MEDPHPLSPAPTVEDVNDQLIPPTHPPHPMVLSHSESDIFIAKPPPRHLSILARVEEDAAMHMLDTSAVMIHPNFSHPSLLPL